MALRGPPAKSVQPIPGNVTNRNYCGMGGVRDNPVVLEIASGLAAKGRYVTRVETGDRQAVVDAGWAARQAGQLLGRPVHVTTAFDEVSGQGLIVTAELADR